MTLGELITAYRFEADDARLPYKLSDVELTEFANDGQNEACRRARLISDSTTPAICKLAFTAGGSPVLKIDARILDIRRVTWTGRSQPLLPRLTFQMDMDYPGWEIHPTQQEPSLYVTDMFRAIRIYPTPSVSGTVNLLVYRLPLDAMVATDDEPEIMTYAHRGLLQWMLFRAFGKQDADVFDTKKAGNAHKLFAQEFGETKSARNQAWQTNEMISFPEPLA